MSDATDLPFAGRHAWWPDFAADEILPGLFQGGTRDDEVIGCGTPRGHYDRVQPYDVVVTLYADALPAPWGVEEFRYGFGDCALTADAVSYALSLATTAHARWTAGRRVLVRCQAGVNRSGLVMALVLMFHGYTAHEAVSLIRERRAPAVLSNDDFVRWLAEDAPALVAARTRTKTHPAGPSLTTPSSTRMPRDHPRNSASVSRRGKT